MRPAAAPLDARVSRPHAVEVGANASPREWDGFAEDRPDANLYHLWRWRRIFEEAFGQEAVYLCARRDGAVAGILPLVIFRSRIFGRFAVSLPFVDGGGLCACDEAAARALVDHATTLAAAWGLAHVELRHDRRLLPDRPVREHKVGMKLALAGSHSQVWDLLDRKVRNQIRKAEKSGLVARMGGAELVGRFYAVFARNMRDLGTPVYPRRFFELVLAAFPDAARVFLVERGGAAIAAAVALVHGDTLAVPWASSLREFRAFCPNNLLYWRIIEHALESGLQAFDFGRSTPGEGTYHFKAQWGARPTPIHWEYVLLGNASLPNLSPTNPRYRAAIALWKRLPLVVTTWLGPKIVRSIP
jgi:FemAB-related protein (PEP-CTERM system-associated)